MTRALLVSCLLLLMGSAGAREKYDARPLSEPAIMALQGKRLAVGRHEMRQLPIVGLTRQDADWRALRNVKADPADLFERELAPAIAKQYGMKLRSDPAVLIDSLKPEELAQALADADYVLDILVTDRRDQKVPDLKAAFLLKEDKFWLGLGVRIQLKYRETGRSVFTANCYSDTSEHPYPQAQRDLVADDARLFRDVFDSLAWRCLRVIARYVPLPDEALPATPAELADPLGAYHASHAPPESSSSRPL
jgi:hypothetical protein